MQESIFQGYSVTHEITIDAINVIHYRHYTSTYSFEGDYHKSWELIYVDTGELMIEVMGGPEETSQAFIVSEKQFFLFQPYRFHRMLANQHDSNVLVVLFEVSHGSEDLLGLCSHTEPTSLTMRSLLKFIFEESKEVFINTNFPDTEMTLSLKHGSLQLLKNYLESFFILCLRSEKYIEKPAIVTKNNIVNRAHEYFLENIHERITLESTASHVGYSKSYLSKLFRRITGKSVIESLIEMRIEQAKIMLAKGLALGEISEKLGFYSPQHFSSTFKKITGNTPSEYSKTIQMYSMCDLGKNAPGF